MRSSFLLFFILVILSSLISIVVQEMVFTEDVYYASLSEQLSVERIESLLKKKGELGWIGYLVKMIFYSFKIFIVAICLLIGLFFVNKNCLLGSLVNIVIKAEFVFLIPSVIILLWFGVIKQSSYTFSDISNFSPLSMLNLFDTGEIDLWLKYPLGAINVFEFLYMGILAQGLSVVTDMSFLKSFKVTLFSYGAALLLWIVFVVFIIISFTA